MAANKKFLKKIADQLIEHEGIRLKPYLCPSGKLTIGVCRNLEDRGITEKEAVMLLEGYRGPPDLYLPKFFMGVRLRLRVTFTLKGRSQVIVVIGG
jgi:hypothetical protein